MVGGIRNAVLVILLAQPMCGQPPETTASVVLRVTTTRGQPVAGAEVQIRNAVVARTDDAGTARLVVGGRDGDSFELHVECPPPLRSPLRPVIVRRLDIQGGEAEHAVKCEVTQRTLIVAIRADNGPDLPILYLGNEIGRTDRSGAAHVKIDADVRERVELSLSTADPKMKDIHPQNPGAVFEPSDHDDVREFAVDFKRDVKKRRAPAVRRGPAVF
jgi:hypothetical protein